MDRLVGIPWGDGNPPEQADCLSLVVYAQEVLYGKHIDLTEIDTCWSDKELRSFSHRTREIIPQFCNQVETPQIGDIILVETLGYCHALTMVDKDLILHTGIGSTSRISRYRPRKDMTFWRLRG